MKEVCAVHIFETWEPTIEAADVGLIEPSARVKQLADNGAAVTVDPNIPSRRYYQSGLEVVRMANVYMEEGNLQNAYILYIRFMTLFVEKIVKHPEYASVPAEMKFANQAQLKDVFPKAEKLKARLLEQFTKEYNQCSEDRKRKLKEAENKAKELKKKQEEEGKLINKSKVIKTATGSNYPSAPQDNPLWNVVSPVPSVHDVLYPDDFATEPNRAPPENYEHAPPIIRDSKPQPSTSNSVYPSPPPTATSLLSGGSSLRTVIVPSFLLDRFVALAAPNTKKKIETCGILAGTLERDRLLITHMIVPKQNGTADSCVTKNEEEIFNYQDQHNLITLGWIHTHPTQTAFLSSVDLHTQCSYQLMMPEAIAIVVAPKYNETRYFSLTPNYGMSFISNCRLGGFHPHPNDPPLFTDATHIILNEYATLEVVDLRR